MLRPRSSAPADRTFGMSDAKMFALLFLSLISDGFDLQTAAFAAPGLVQEWGTSRAALGPVLSAGLVGVLIGAPFLGWFGDRRGRKRAIVIGSLVFGSFSLLTAAAASIEQLILLRFLTGIGLGGVLPNVIALTAELAPRRIRPMLTAAVSVAIPLGGATVGIVAAALVPSHGWRILFIVGGAVPLLIALLVQLGLDESPYFTRATGATEAANHAIDAPRGSTAELFHGKFALVTPVVWLLFAAGLLTIYVLSSWLPLVLESGGMSPQSAALMNTMLQFGGAVGGLIASLLLGRVGLPLIGVLLGGAWLLVALLALVPLPDVALAVVLGVCGICIFGAQTAINGCAGLIYPTPIRAKGVGFGLGVGRIASISGPIIGSMVIGLGARGTQDLFFVPLAPLGIGFVAAILLARWGSLLQAEEPSPVS